MLTNKRKWFARLFDREEYRRAKPVAHTVLLASIIAMSNVGMETAQAVVPPGQVEPKQVGSGFTVTAADLKYILQQIKIAEAHVAANNPNPTTDPDNCQALVGPGVNQIPTPLLSFGLRTVNGACNNLQPSQDKYGAADQVFPRLTSPNFEKPADSIPSGFPGAGSPTNYNQTSGFVFDSEPRTISNLIVDQTSSNPAAVYVAGHPARAQADPDVVVPCTVEPSAPGAGDGQPTGCTPAHETLFIPNITTDVGLSPPFNSLFTIFGQFFDHGLDKITNGGNGQVFVPLKADDPLIAGPDHILVDDPNTPVNEEADNIPPQQRFMVLTRGTIVGPGRDAMNTDTPFVDQSQTYTSHSSHQVFLREYILVSGKPKATGKFLSTVDGGMATWAMIKDHAANLLGLQLVDVDVNNIPMVAVDQYGNFIPGPNGFAQFVTATGLVEGDPASPVPAPANVTRIETAFLNDIAHSAGPGSIDSPKPVDDDLVAGGSLDTPVPAGSYDNELLDLHYICGDGRCNENIGLTAIHQVFHLEHDRLVDYFYHEDGTNIPGSVTGVLTQDPALLAEYKNVNLVAGPNKTFTFEERLFQAARFVTEMQYQHLVFEEFARKVQPAINPFEPFAFNQTDLNSAITAEFAHAVYRFGHSMLTETLPRLNEDGSHNDIALFDGFLNPAAFNNGGSVGHLDDRKATASLIMGLSDQGGNEIDEFVTDVLRNRLVGLPLDLPAINMTRARSEGIPSLNNVRKQVFAATNDAQMIPYANWVDFELNLKHSDDPERSTLVNFIAAYGKHPLVQAATTLADKRAAAKLIVSGDVSVPDSADFLFSLGAWANINGVSTTGVDGIDLWVGGLAEKTNLFGGLLGSTFNYVFEKQLTDLQNGDRFYYLARTPGMNLRAQLEGNSFSELVMRNTDSHTLKADPFATADCKFELANLSSPAVTPTIDINGNPSNLNTVFGTGSVNDDPASECNENHLLIRMPDGTFKYRETNLDDPVGINGQLVMNGTGGVDQMFGGNDNDTLWGLLGDDILNGGGGDDFVLGGEGDDIILDFAGMDFLKGGPGNDAIDAGIGDDIIIGGDGKDFTNGGGNINETFSGPGDDFAIAGQGTDAVFGDSGDDWIEGGDQPDLLIGDSSSLFFDDHNIPGHDILIGQGGDDDYDMEGGDDIGVAGPGVEKVAGGAGFDWEIGLGDPQPQNADLELKLVNVLPAFETRDRYNEIEALSGWKFNDTLRGDNIIPSQVTGGGSIGCDALDQAGLDRIPGLDPLIPALDLTNPDIVTAASVVANTVTNYCLLTGNVWGAGNILLGGEGSDKLEGRGANDILDGDRYMNVRLSVRSNPLDPSTEVGTTDLMENKPTVPNTNFGPGTDGMTLQQAVFAGKVNPGQIVAVREILTPTVPAGDCFLNNDPNTPNPTPQNCDVALFSGLQADYAFIADSDPSGNVISITATDARGIDGVDTLWNMEAVSFCATPGATRGTCEAFGPIQPIIVNPVTFEVTITGSRAFGNVAVGSSLAQTVTLKNTGTANIVVSGISLTGVDVADFSFSPATPATCGTIPIAGECDITVTFTPTTAGAKSATLVINHNATISTSTVDLSGTGIGPAPVAAVSLSSLAFGSVSIGGVSGTQSITVKNTGNADLVVSSATVTGDNAFSVSANTCGTVTPNGTCSVTVSFLPTTVGAKAATLDIVHNAAGSSTSVPMAGTGTSPGTGAGVGVSVNAIVGASAGVSPGTQPPVNAAKLSLPTALDFGTVKAKANKTMAVTVTNQLSSLLHISFVNTTGGAFSATRGGCPVILGVGKSCKIRVTFNPTVPGKVYTGKLTLSGNKPMTMSLSGTGRR
ncbi:hypothetical protein MGMO_37c00230 [Methyloglobulus morosus KoM1]|uniref:Choice-of-anchor D domain-containing protein n=1 Tax=Methyloglobulus morosus KoM1 TaxID=1116472 RepID=V5C3Q6_9GAMM|nr:peroxidase family protein [Methyloglobulus morosus]ESS73062.1 hypothetical protein MGMO_37c00230 [Methyloglobulus morosus KoM1]